MNPARLSDVKRVKKWLKRNFKVVFLREESAQQKESKEIAISQTPYWEVARRKLNPKIFKTEAIKSKANCQTCHKDAESGIFAKNAVDYKKLRNL